MDPNETLRQIRRLTDYDRTLTIEESNELVEFFRALDEWLINGGFLPPAWSPSRD